MGEGDGGREGQEWWTRNIDDGFRVTFGWAEDANSEPKQEVAFTGEELNTLIAYCMQLTKRGVQLLGGRKLPRNRINDLAPEKVEGSKLFWGSLERTEWCNRQGEGDRSATPVGLKTR